MINKLDTVLADLEHQEKVLKEQVVTVAEDSKEAKDATTNAELVRIDELIAAIKKVNCDNIQL